MAGRRARVASLMTGVLRALLLVFAVVLPFVWNLPAVSAAAPATDPTAAESWIWPSAPEQPRIAWIRNLSNAEDLGIRRSFFGRIVDLVLGAADTRMVRPMAVVASHGVVYVADPGVKAVHRYDSQAGEHVLVRGPDGAPLPSPVGLARSVRGDVYVTDSALGAVLRIRPGAKVAERMALDVKLDQPTGIAFDNERQRLYVTDTAKHVVHVLSTEGRLLQSIGGRGAGEGEFNYPTYLWIDGAGRLLVTDSLNFRVQSFDADGRFRNAFGRTGDGAGDALRQKGIAMDRFGHLYVADAGANALQVYSDDGKLLLSLGGLGQDPGEFWLPAGVFIDTEDGNTIYVADSHNRRVQILRYVGGAT